MNIIHKILDEAFANHLLPKFRIIETGNQDTVSITEWVSREETSTFDTVDLNSNIQEANHKILEQKELAAYCTFHTQEHKKFLTELKWVDVAFIHTDSLQNGLEEFQLAASIGAYMIAMSDYQTNAALAIKQAKRFGWSVLSTSEYFESEKDYHLIIRPKS